jgi:hypothetical protein
VIRFCQVCCEQLGAAQVLDRGLYETDCGFLMSWTALGYVERGWRGFDMYFEGRVVCLASSFTVSFMSDVAASAFKIMTLKK